MTRRPTPPDLHRWLAAEAAGRDAEAEGALGALFAALPAEVPAAGFAARVMRTLPRMQAAPAVPVSAWAAVAGTRAFRAAVAACLALVALGLPALAKLPALVAPLVGRLTFAGLIDGGRQALVATVHLVASAAVAWEWLARVAGWLATAAGTPEAALVLLAALGAAALALARLSDLMAHERSWSHG